MTLDGDGRANYDFGFTDLGHEHVGVPTSDGVATRPLLPCGCEVESETTYWPCNQGHYLGQARRLYQRYYVTETASVVFAGRRR